MNLQEILQHAAKNKWSTGHFNASESDQFRAICEAAQEIRSVALIGTSEGEAKHLGYLQAVALRNAFRREMNIPVFLNSDHHKSVEAAKRAIDAGYDSIHVDLSHLSFDENAAGTREVVKYAKETQNLEINVEGELGYLRGDSKVQQQKIEVRPEDYTDPMKAKEFIQKTGVNRLAIAVGNIHGISLDEPALDIERIQAIRTEIPEETTLVLHAGSGIPEDQIRSAIAAGIANIHINTDIRVAYSHALREELLKNPEETTPYKFDSPAREILKKLIIEKLTLFGAINRI